MTHLHEYMNYQPAFCIICILVQSKTRQNVSMAEPMAIGINLHPVPLVVREPSWHRDGTNTAVAHPISTYYVHACYTIHIYTQTCML